MKKAVFGVIVLGLASLGFAQENIKDFSVVALDEAIITPVNVNYITEVMDENTPDIAKELQMKAARYDIATNPDYDRKEKRAFDVVFKSSNGDLLASYSTNGKIIYSREKYKDVTLPVSIRKEVFTDETRGYKMVRNQFLSEYFDDKLMKRIYKIRLKEGETSKKLIIELKSAKD